VRRTGPSELGFRLLLGVATLAFLWLLSPFLGPILWAIVAAMLFEPMNAWLLRRWPRRRSTAAALTVVAIVAAVVVPALLLGSALIDEASDVAARVRSGQIDVPAVVMRLRDHLPPWFAKLIGADRLSDVAAIRDWISAHFAASLQNIARRALDIGQSAFGFIAALGVMIYMSFFFIRDGRTMIDHVRRAAPLDNRHRTELLNRFAAVVHAMIKGSLLVAAAQGIIGGIIFWLLGIHGALLWGVAMGFMSLLPAVGTGIVWVPVAIYELATGAIWQGIVLVFCGLFVIGMVDNVLRPVLVGRDAKMPDYIVFLSTLGGLELFGFIGFLLGPLIAGLFLAAWQLHDEAGAGGSDGQA